MPIGTVAENASAFGTGILNIDATRIPINEELPDYSPSRSGLGRMVFMAAARVSKVPIALRDIRTRAAGPPILFTTAVTRS